MEYAGAYVSKKSVEDSCIRDQEDGIKKMKVRREIKEEGEEEKPLSPMSRIFQEGESDVYIILSVGFKSPTDPLSFKANLVHTLLKHPRFSRVQVIDGGELKWEQTNVELDNHVIVVPAEDMETKAAEKFVEDYMANLSKTKLCISIPMWNCHILNLRTSDDAKSHVLMRIYHSLGDGTSLMSLLLSCSRKLSDPLFLPTFPATTNKPVSGIASSSFLFGHCIRFWSILLLFWNTLVDVLICVATTYVLKDTQTALKAPSSAVASISRRIVRRTFSLADVQLIKHATNTTINDVVLAITQAGLSRYLNRKNGTIDRNESAKEYKENNLPQNTRLTSTLFMNLRSSPGIYR